MKKKLALVLAVCLVGCLALTLTSCGSKKSDDGKVYTLTYNSQQGSTTPFFTEVEQYFCQELESMSDGRIKVEIYNNGSLAAQGTVFDALEAGTVDIGWDNPGQYVGRFPLAFMMEQSGLGYTSAEMAGKIFNEYLTEYCAEEFSAIHPVISFCTGPMPIASTTKIAKLEDINGMQVRTGGSSIDAFKALGFAPVAMGAGEVYEAIRLNNISGTIGTFDMFNAFKINEVANYAVVTSCFNGMQMIAMSKQTYESLPADLQKVVDEAAAKATEKALTFNDEQAAKVQKELGMEVTVLDEKEAARWNEKCLTVTKAYAAELDKQGKPGTEALEWLLKKVKEYK